MKGFVVTYNNKQLSAALPDNGITGLEFVLQECNSFWSTSGLILNSGEKCLWNSDSLNIGDEITVEFVQINKPSKTLNEMYCTDEEIRKHVFIRYEEDELQMIQKEFELLKQLLEQNC
jgi:hypothetical protein